jgi:hypothetical protein
MSEQVGKLLKSVTIILKDTQSPRTELQPRSTLVEDDSEDNRKYIEPNSKLHGEGAPHITETIFCMNFNVTRHGINMVSCAPQRHRISY